MTDARRPHRTPAGLPARLTRRGALCLLGGGALAACAALAGCGCSADTGTPTIDVEPIPVWTSPYDWDAVMKNTRGRLYYYPDGALSSRVGVDVSDYDGDVDWARVAADGIEFAFVRVGYRGYTEGGLFADEHFEENIDGAHAQGIPCGVYMFSSATSELEAREEAEFALSRLGDRSLEYPVVFDQEKSGGGNGRADALTAAQYTANARAFCDRIAAAGYQTMVYGNKHQLALLDLDDVPFWYAEYDVSKPTGQFDFAIWQYTSTGSVDGIQGTCDLNIEFLVEEEPDA